MKDKKHIDKLFKDRFKNFEASPSPQVWDNIQAQLKKEKEDDRKVIPLWWKFAGIAALIALLLTIGNTVFNPFDNNTTITTEETSPLDDPETKGDVLLKDTIENTEVATEENGTPKTSEEDSKETTANEVLNTQQDKDRLYKQSEAAKNAVAVESTSEKSSEKKDATTNKLIKEAASVKEKEAMAVNSNLPKENKDKETVSEKNITDKNDPLIKKEIGIEETVKVEVADENKKKKEGNAVDTQKTDAEVAKAEEESKKRSILDAINEKNEEEAVAVTNKPEDRWAVAPNFAPVYYNSLSAGSSIDPMFADNAQNGDVNFSYGVQVSYALNDRLSVRSGVSNVDLSYATSGLELGTGPVSAALRSVDYGDKQVVVIALDKGTFASLPEGANPLDNVTPKNTSGDVELIQNINYYEVPLELKYALLNTRFGVNVIGGFSTLFLGSNDVSVRAGDFRDTLGEANNLSSLSFSTNVGVGFDYKISKKLKFNIEPMFKYQLNPYTDSSVNFKPYYVGIYSGLSFKF